MIKDYKVITNKFIIQLLYAAITVVLLYYTFYDNMYNLIHNQHKNNSKNKI